MGGTLQARGREWGVTRCCCAVVGRVGWWDAGARDAGPGRAEMAAARRHNQPADRDPHNKLLGVVISLVGVGILLLAMALAAGDSEGQGSAWGSPLALASEPKFAVGFAFCFGWWWVLLGRPGLRTKAD